MLGLNAQEASILNFLRVDAAEKQRDRRYEIKFSYQQKKIYITGLWLPFECVISTVR